MKWYLTIGLCLAACGAGMATAQDAALQEPAAQDAVAPEGGSGQPAGEGEAVSLMDILPEEMHKQQGPTTGQLGTEATINVPEGYFFTDGDGSRLILEMMENPTGDRELGMMMPNDGSWFLVFEYDASGYVKDDDADKLDAAAMLQSIREGTEAGNEERRRRGWGEMRIIGWEQEPHYDATTNNLVWAIRGASEQGENVNYNTRILGRGGVMEVTLVCDPGQLSTVVPQFNELLKGFAYVEGKKYSQFVQGDKVAAYGLSALVVGGVAAAAVKSKGFWKLIAVGVAALGAGAKKIFGGRRSRA